MPVNGIILIVKTYSLNMLLNRLLTTFFVMVASLAIGLDGVAKSNTKELRGIIKQYDVADTLTRLKSDNPVQFWRLLMETNKNYGAIKKVAKSGKARETKREISDALGSIRASMSSMPCLDDTASQRVINYLQDFAGVKKIFRETNLHFLYSEDENAFTTPDGNIFICLGLVERLRFDTDLIMAVYSHELAHFVLQHSFALLYAENKKKTRQKLLAEIASGITTAVTVASNYYAQTNGVNVDWNSVEANVRRTNRRIASSAMSAIEKFSIKYNREQEFEADIIGYYFMEWCGIGGIKYIEMLKLIDSELEIFHNDESTHPLTSDRIKLLNMLPEMHNNPKAKRNTWAKDDLNSDGIYYNDDLF